MSRRRYALGFVLASLVVVLWGRQAQAQPCDDNWAEKVVQSVRPAVVRVETVASLGAGFLFYKQNWVATSYHLVERGRPVSVVTTRGQQIPAVVVAVDAQNDLAVLKLKRPLTNVTPLRAPSKRGLVVGTEVLFMGHPYASQSRGRLRGLLNWSVGRGSISAQNAQLIQLDAAFNPGNSGGPVVGCNGRVLGVVSAKLSADGIGFAIPTRLLTQLATQVGVQPIYKGQVRWQLRAGAAFQVSPGRAALGPTLGGGVTLYDRLQLTLRYSHLLGVSFPAAGPTVLEQSSLRNIGELEVRHRWFIQAGGASAYLSALTGLAGGRVVDSSRVLTATTVDSQCLSGPCPLQVVTTEVSDERWRAWPIMGLSSSFGGVVDVSYAFLADVEGLKDSLHRFSIELSY